MQDGNEKSFTLYDAVGGVVRDELSPAGDLGDDFFSDLDSAATELLESTKDFEKKDEESDDLSELDLSASLDKSNDSVRMYLREMGTVPLLTREGEIELAKRIERGQGAVRKALSRSALVVRDILAMADTLQQDPLAVRDIVVMPDLVVTDETVAEQSAELLRVIGEIEKHYKKAQQSRQKLQAISRGMKPKMHRSLRWSQARTMVCIS